MFKTLRAQLLGIAAAAALAVTSLVASIPASIPAALTAAAPVAVPAAIATLGFTSSTPANAVLSYNTTVRSAHMTDVVTASDNSGAHGAKMKFYNGCTKPSGVSSAAGCTLLAAISWPSTAIGTVSSGVLTINTSPTQTNSGFVAGTPTFIDVTDSADNVVLRMDVCGSAPCWTFPNPVVNGQNIVVSGQTLTAGNP